MTKLRWNDPPRDRNPLYVKVEAGEWPHGPRAQPRTPLAQAIARYDKAKNQLWTLQSQKKAARKHALEKLNEVQSKRRKLKRRFQQTQADLKAAEEWVHALERTRKRLSEGGSSTWRGDAAKPAWRKAIDRQGDALELARSEVKRLTQRQESQAGNLHNLGEAIGAARRKLERLDDPLTAQNKAIAEASLRVEREGSVVQRLRQMAHRSDET